jgi:hypothetical protein
MKKEFVSYEIALALKELGFNENCMKYFGRENKLIIVKDNYGVHNTHPTILFNIAFVSAPLYQQAFSFLLKKLEDYSITYWYDGSGHINNSEISDWEYNFNSEEECLKKLIKIVKEEIK